MTDLPQMAVYATRADAADTFLDELGPVPAHQEALVAAVRDLAEKLRITARRHVTVGFVGVWTTGKSLLISMLSGVPDLLPVSNAPATGNVTRIRITPVPAGNQAKRDGATVSLLSPAAVAEMADYIVREIVALVTKEGLPYDVRPLIGYQLMDRGDPSRPDLRPLTEFLSPLWPDPALNKQIRLWSTELFQIAGALRAGGHLLPASMPDTPRHIRDLGDAVLIGDGRRVPEQFPDPGHRAPILATELALPHNLQVIQPLIHEVALHLDLPADVWSFAGIPVDLLDFPGLASGSLRDRFLAERELGGTAVVAFVVDAEKAKNDDVDRLYGILEKSRRIRAELADSLLAVVNRFDRVHPPDPLPVSVADLARSRDWATISAVVDELTRDRPGRVALTSALTIAVQAGYEPPEARPQDRREAEDAPRQWDEAIAALRAADPDDPVTAALAGYQLDGGLRFLRDLISAQVTEHGLRIWLAEARELDQSLADKLDGLRPLEPTAACSDEERARLEDLIATLTKLQRGLTDRLDEVRLLTNLRLGDEYVPELLRDEAARIVYRWGEWLATIDSDGHKPDKHSTGGGRLKRWGSIDQGQARTAPKVGPLRSTADLRPAYDDALRSLNALAEKKIVQSLIDWTRQAHCDLGVADLAGRLAADEMYGPGRRGDGDLLRTLLSGITTPAWVGRRMIMMATLADQSLLSGLVPDAGQEVDRDLVNVGYPFADDRALPWHEDRYKRLAEAHKDEADAFQVDRLRREVVNGLHNHVCRRAQAMLDLVCDQVSQDLEEIRDEAIPSPGEVREMTGEQPGQPEQEGDS
jgi:hypothetical protein